MSITYRIENMTRNAADGGVIRVEATASMDREGHTASHSVFIAFQPDSTTESFVQYEDLTEEVVISWVEQRADVDRLTIILNERLNSLINPITLNGVPWE